MYKIFLFIKTINIDSSHIVLLICNYVKSNVHFTLIDSFSNNNNINIKKEYENLILRKIV